MTWELSERLRLRKPARIKYDQVRQTDLLLLPERIISLNPTAGAILWLCNGNRSVADIIEELEAKYHHTNLQEDVLEFLTDALDRGWVETCT